MRTRWWWWLLSLSPAAAGVVSIALGVGDFRSSGLILGVSVSLGLVAIILLVTAPWRGKSGWWKWLATVPGLVLGLVALLGVSEGLPEFLQARGLFLDVDAVGPVAVAYHDGTLLILGNDSNGGFAWASDEGSEWARVGEDSLTGLEIADATGFGASVVVVGQSAEAEGVVLVSVDGATFEEAGRFTNSEYGTIPQGLAGFDDRLMVISEIYGNDVEFYVSNDARSWAAGQPAAVFDDGESARDIACSDEVCVGVGFADATYRRDLDANIGIAWVSDSGSDYQVLDHSFDTESLDAVAWNPAGFLAVANSPDNQGLAWQSPDGTEWKPVSAPFTEMTVDGVAAVDGSYVVFGRNPRTGHVMVWTSDDTTEWSESVVATGRPEDSQIRSVISTQSGLIAAGIDGATFDVLVWASPDGADWQDIATLPGR